MLECSVSFTDMTGYSRAELIGHTSLELGLIEPEVRGDAAETVQRHRVTGAVQTRVRRRDGSEITVEFTTQLLSDAVMLTIVRDIT